MYHCLSPSDQTRFLRLIDVQPETEDLESAESSGPQPRIGQLSSITGAESRESQPTDMDVETVRSALLAAISQGHTTEQCASQHLETTEQSVSRFLRGDIVYGEKKLQRIMDHLAQFADLNTSSDYFPYAVIFGCHRV